MRNLSAHAALLLFALTACGASAPARDAGPDGGPDAGVDAGPDAGIDAGPDAGPDAGMDAGQDAGADAGPDAGDGGDAGPVSFTPAELTALAALSPQTLPAPPADPANAYADNAQAALLGHKLFVDPLFSGALLDGDNDGSVNTLGVKGQTGRVACAGCHVPSAGFLDNRTLGHQITLASGWGLRRTPSLLDVGQAKSLMWDGRADDVLNQIFGPIETATEMNSSRLFVAEELARRYSADYQAIFGAMPALADGAQYPQLSAAQTGCSALDGGTAPPVCHGMPGDNAEYDQLSADKKDAVTRVVVNAGKSLGAYLRLLSCGPGRFDQFMRGDASAMSASEQRGARLFIGKATCVTCHAGPFLTDEKFHNVGLAPAVVAVTFLDINDRGAATGFPQLLANPLNAKGTYSDGYDGRDPAPAGAAQEGAFRTPGLRCMMRRPSFMHTAQMGSVEAVVAFFNQGGYPHGYPGTNELSPLSLSAAEQADLVAFLKTLEGPGPDASLVDPP